MHLDVQITEASSYICAQFQKLMWHKFTVGVFAVTICISKNLRDGEGHLDKLLSVTKSAISPLHNS